MYRLNTAIKQGQRLCPRDHVFTFQERCPVASSYVKRDYEKRGKFKIGDRVWTKTVGPFDFLDKLEARFGPSGAGTVVDHVGSYTYKIQLDNGETTTLRENRLRLEPTSAPRSPPEVDTNRTGNPVSVETWGPTDPEGGEL